MKNRDVKRFNWIVHVGKRWLVPCIVVLLLGIFTTLSLIESSRQSATADEVAHIPAGISYAQTGDLRMNQEHPVLVKYLSGVSAQIFSHPTFSKDWHFWKTSNEWYFGRQVLYFSPQNDADKIVFWARVPILILSIALGLIIFFWASSLFGQTTGLAALVFYSLDPTIIAYSHLVVFDLPMTTFVAASMFCLWSARKKTTLWGYILAGLFLGLSLTAKFSAVALIILLPLLLYPATRYIKGHRNKKIKFYLSRLGVVYGVTGLTIWMVYLLIQGNQVWRRAGILPAAFTRTIGGGIARYQGIKPMYLDGYLSSKGMWWYFPGSFLAKSTLVFLLVLVAGSVYIMNKKQNWFSDTKIFLLAPTLFTGALAVLSRFDIGLRLIFIIYPLLFIVAGYMASLVLKQSRKAKLWLGLALVYYAFTLITAFPSYLAYSNELFGGRAHSYRYLADSNLDIGQGLKELKGYTTDHHIKNMSIVYFGDADPKYYGFNLIDISIQPFTDGLPPYLIPKEGGWLAVSASYANYAGLHKLNYQIRGTYPKDVVAGSILIYKLPRLPG